MELAPKDKSIQRDSLHEWILNIGIFWRNRFETPFTYIYDAEIEDKDKGNRHVSVALDVLIELIKPIDATITRENMAYVLQKSITTLNKISEEVSA